MKEGRWALSLRMAYGSWCKWPGNVVIVMKLAEKYACSTPFEKHLNQFLDVVNAIFCLSVSLSTTL